MICSGINDLDEILKELKPDNFMVLAGDSAFNSLSKNELVYKIIASSINNGERIAYYHPGYPFIKTYLFSEYEINKKENLHLFSFNNVLEVSKNLEAKKEEYDLIIIEDVSALFEKSIQDYFKEFGGLTKYRVPVILVKSTAYEEELDEEQLYNITKDLAEFFVFVEETNTTEVKIRIYDFRIKKYEFDFLCCRKKKGLIRNDGKINELYNNAKSLGLNLEDASDYARYWNENKEEKI